MNLKSLSLSVMALGVLIGFNSQNAVAQNSEGESVVSLTAGYSIAIDFWKESIEALDDAGENNVTVSTIPAIGLFFDHAISDVFSIGVAGSFQSLSAEFENTFTSSETNTEVTEIAKIGVNRLNFAVRPLFHYGGSDELDLYSGLRIGWNMLSTTIESNDPDVEGGLDDLNFDRPSVGLVLFGMRYFFTENIGANLDLHLGTPYLASFGVSARF